MNSLQSTRLLKRRSKSVDDLSTSLTVNDTTPLTHGTQCWGPKDIQSTAPPAASSNWHWSSRTPRLPCRRYSSCVEINTKECQQIATIYGWGTTEGSDNETSNSQPSKLSRDLLQAYAEPLHTSAAPRRQKLHRASRSFGSTSSISSPSKKFARMFGRRRKSLTLATSPSHPRLNSINESSLSVHPLDTSGELDHAPWHSEFERPDTKGIVSAIIAAAHRSESEIDQSLGWVGMGESDTDPPMESNVTASPAPPVENDPHVFDLLHHDSSHFIHYTQRDNTMILSSATVEKLVEKLTREMDSDFLLDFFLTFRQFVTPIKLCKLLILRFRWALLQDNDERRLVRIRSFVVIRHWLTHYWAHDFMPSRTLRFMLCTFLTQLRTHPVILASPRDARIIRNLRHVLKQQRQMHKLAQKQDHISQMLLSHPSSPFRYTSTTSLDDIYHVNRHNPNRSGITSGHDRIRSLPRYSINSRKDSAIGLMHTHTLPTKDLRPSMSTPALPFLNRSRRVSVSSHRSVNEENAWSGKMNFSIKTIKRTVPSMCQSLFHGITHPQAELSCERCLSNRAMKRRSSFLLRSASRFFDAKPPAAARDSYEGEPRLSTSTPTPTLSNRINSAPVSPLCSTHASVTPTPQRLRRRSTSFYRQSLNASHLLHTPFYKSEILRYRSELIAQQFCILEQRMLQTVTWNELAELRWRKRSRTNTVHKRNGTVIHQVDQEKGVEQLINFFNMICQWVASEIVRSRSLEIRVKVIEKFIRIALKCYHHRNYSTLMQILLGLQSPAVSRLEKTWQRVDHYELQIFGDLKKMAKPFRNWKNVRDAMNKATEDISESSAVETILTQSKTYATDLSLIQGCIPFLGLYLSDLVFNAELPTFIEHSRANLTVSEIKDSDLNARLCTHLVNFNKFRITAFQVLSRAYNFAIHAELYTRLQKPVILDNIEIRKASFLCEE
ncbi:ras guanine nucleotide exchange factor domain-containing protein [Radiomyces spectabilis]|uniref:ras guanine nucleotide exchange factor domain-containing protein n=1 Tax=Radiomyces spectabilis TaxID=64574 RepID=UPI002220B6B8|nr:ras guanine nucleotide exchange factor domain-containing protein [Radiomyces spectabilis]KAI8376066.1 ras guanine nucleotide exchange factor domain-containing protein [Radiomyces spectabilis]